MDEKKRSTVIPVGKYKFYMDGYLQSNLTKVKALVKNDWDFIFVVDGMEGGGKSTITIQLALYLNPNFTVENIAFTSEEFEEKILKANKFDVIVYDEAITGLYSREAMKYINTTLTKLLAQIRQKNLFVFILIPSFFDLDKYVSMWRGRGLFHIYTDDYKRGYFTFFNYDKKKTLYTLGKKYYNYNMVKPSFKGRFVSFNPFDKEYRKLKLKAIDKRQGQTIDPLLQRNRLMHHVWTKHGVQQKEMADIIGISQSAVAHACKQFKKE